ncbi:MAG TPA: hypothetical protein VIJ86_02190 [Acidimicrobiales bacterium]
MKFFLPDKSDEIIQSQADHLKARNVRAIRFIEYEHDHSRIEVEVGKPRKEYGQRIGPRGGRIAGADFERLAHSTGKTVQMILLSGGLIEVYSEPNDGWSFPSYVGLNELKGDKTEYFDPWD